MNLQKHTYFSVSSFRAPIRNTADYSPFGIQLDGRTLSYAPPAPAPPSVTVVYQHKFDDNPSMHPYTTAPNQLNTKLTNVNWLNSQSSWTNFAGFTGKAIATNSATPDTTRLYLNLTVNSGFMLDVNSYSFYHRSSTTGYTNYQLLVNGVLVGSGSIFVSSGSTLQSTGTINVANAIAGLTGSVTITLKLFGGSNGNNATFRLDDFTLNGYTQEVQIYAEGYRRGFNGMEGDSEFKGQGNSYTTEFRQYDARMGRWLSLDPLMDKFPWQSPYCAMDNNPINLVDPLGSESEEKGGGDEPKQTIGTAKNPVEVKEVTICGNCGVKNAVDKIASGLEAPKEAAPKTGNKALENVDLSFFGDGFTTTSPQKRPFDESTRTSSQKNAYAFSTSFAKTYTGTLIVLASAGVLFEAAPVFLILAPKIETKVATEVTMEAGEVAAKGGAKFYSEATFKAFERQLAKDGMKSILKTQSRIQKNLAEHIQKFSEIKKAGGYSSSVEREIQTFQSQLDALKDLLK